MERKNKRAMIIVFAVLIVLILSNFLFLSLWLTEEAKNNEETFITAYVVGIDDNNDGAYVFNRDDLNDGIAYAEYGKWYYEKYVEVGLEVILILDDGGTKENPQWVIVGWLN